MTKKQKQAFMSRVYMYIFLSLSFLTGLGIFNAYAYADLVMCNEHPEVAYNSPFIALVVDR
ncbi:MAG: hypothetical protein PHH06_02385 [Candidatus Gracilibacteria bacterium]|nr:hypothetical protein [Candidatus Gracilibacteria bacterium]